MRQPPPPAIFPYAGFNPRICKRCDVNVRYDALNMPVSIHASVKDATALGAKIIGYDIVSIHASVKDATPCL